MTLHTAFDLRGDLERSAEEAVKRGIITEDQANAFLDEQDARDGRGEFLLAGVIFTAAGRKP